MRHSSQLGLAVLQDWALGGLASGCQQTCPVDHRGLPHVLGQPLSCNTYTVSLTAATARHQPSVPGVGGATAPFTTSTAPILANMSSLRRVKSSVRRPTLLCRHRYAATASASLTSLLRGSGVRKMGAYTRASDGGGLPQRGVREV
jgi:hypothetical protein